MPFLIAPVVCLSPLFGPRNNADLFRGKQFPVLNLDVLFPVSHPGAFVPFPPGGLQHSQKPEVLLRILEPRAGKVPISKSEGLLEGPGKQGKVKVMFSSHVGKTTQQQHLCKSPPVFAHPPPPEKQDADDLNAVGTLPTKRMWQVSWSIGLLRCSTLVFARDLTQVQVLFPARPAGCILS